MSRINKLINDLINFVDEEFCKADDQDCNSCSYYDGGNCPVLLTKQYLEEEGYDEN